MSQRASCRAVFSSSERVSQLAVLSEEDLADGSLRGALVVGLSIIVVIMSLLKWLAAGVVVEAIFLLIWGIAAFSLNAPLQLLMVEKAKAAPRLAATLNQSAFNLGDAAGAWAGSALLNLGAGYGDLPFLSAGLALTSLFFVCFIGTRTAQIPVTSLGETK